MTNKEVYNEEISNFPSVTHATGLLKILNLDDLKAVVKHTLPENCYKKEYFEPLKLIRIRRDGTNGEIRIDGKDNKLRIYYYENHINPEENLKSFNFHQLTDITKYLRKITENKLGTCFDVNINEEYKQIRYLIEYLNNNKKTI